MVRCDRGIYHSSLTMLQLLESGPDGLLFFVLAFSTAVLALHLYLDIRQRQVQPDIKNRSQLLVAAAAAATPPQRRTSPPFCCNRRCASRLRRLLWQTYTRGSSLRPSELTMWRG